MTANTVFERTRSIRLTGGRFVNVIETRDTPPPDEGFYRCMYCGEQRAVHVDIPYDMQSDHEDCITGVAGQAFMGRGWQGWACDE